MLLRVTNTMTEHYHDKGLLPWLDSGIAPLVLRSSSINRVGLNNGTSGNLLPPPKNLGLGPDISQGPIMVIVNYFFCYNQSYFIQACVPLPFIIAIVNLQFNKTLCSVTCINCKLYTCLNSSISLKNDSLLISSISMSLVVTNKSPMTLGRRSPGWTRFQITY